MNRKSFETLKNYIEFKTMEYFPIKPYEEIFMFLEIFNATHKMDYFAYFILFYSK